MRRVGRGTIALGLALPFALGIGVGAAVSQAGTGAKDVAVPDGWAEVWPSAHTLEGEDVVLAWGDLAGADPTSAPDDVRFDPAVALERLEDLYALDVDELVVAREDGPAGEHKVVVVVDDTWSQSAGATDTAGRASTASSSSTLASVLADAGGAAAPRPLASVTAGVGLLEVDSAHLDGDAWELARGFAEVVQHFALLERPDSGPLPEGSQTFWDASAGYLASLAVPGHADDLADLVRSPELAWSSARLGTGGRLLLEYLAERDGPQVIGEVWRGAHADELPLDAYRRLTGLSSEALHRRITEYAMRTVTWDLAGSDGLAAAIDEIDPLLLQDRATPVEADPTTAGVYRVTGSFAPSDQGYALVRLVPDSDGTTVRVRLRGHEDAATGAGWSYGFVAIGDGLPRYSTVTESSDAEIDFTLRDREHELYLVVVGAPSVSHDYGAAAAGSTYRYPFEIAVQGAGVVTADPEAAVEGAHRHVNGGGWVDDMAAVADTVYVAPGAVVRGAARLSGSVRVEGRAWVADGAVLGDAVVVRDSAVVAPGASLGGDVVVGGDAVVSLTCTAGRYLANDTSRPCDGGIGEPDVNEPVTPFAAADLTLGAGPTPSPAPTATETEPTATPSAAPAAPGASPTSPARQGGPTADAPGGRETGQPTGPPTGGGVDPPDPVAAGCTATYTAKTWPGGFQGTIVLTAGSEGLQAWTLTWTLPEGQQITEAWAVMLGTRGSSVTGENTSWNGTVAAGQSISLGVNGTAEGDSGSVVPAVTCTRTR